MVGSGKVAVGVEGVGLGVASGETFGFDFLGVFAWPLAGDVLDEAFAAEDGAVAPVAGAVKEVEGHGFGFGGVVDGLLELFAFDA